MSRGRTTAWRLTDTLVWIRHERGLVLHVATHESVRVPPELAARGVTCPRPWIALVSGERWQHHAGYETPEAARRGADAMARRLRGAR